MDIWKLSFEEQIEFLQHKLRHKEELEKLYVKQEKEIERLQQTVSMLSGDRDLYIEEIKQKNAEIQRLREALRHIADYEGGPVDLIWKEMRDIAIQALQQKDSE